MCTDGFLFCVNEDGRCVVMVPVCDLLLVCICALVRMLALVLLEGGRGGPGRL